MPPPNMPWRYSTKYDSAPEGKSSHGGHRKLKKVGQKKSGSAPDGHTSVPPYTPSKIWTFPDEKSSAHVSALAAQLNERSHCAITFFRRCKLLFDYPFFLHGPQ